MKRMVVAGTGTNVGKTWLSCALLRRWRLSGLHLDVRKPVLSGTGPDDDAHLLLHANGEQDTADAYARVAPWRFVAPLSPDEAARREGVELRLRDVVAAAHCSAPTLIETAGGVMSPVAVDGLVIDALHAWQAPVVLVAGGYLGTISHTLTALEVLRHRDVDVLAVVVMQAHDPSVITAIAVRTKHRVVGVAADDSAAAAKLADDLSWFWSDRPNDEVQEHQTNKR
jgi:dethiobiotin synthetase